jgi:hypothetical protein
VSALSYEAAVARMRQIGIGTVEEVDWGAPSHRAPYRAATLRVEGPQGSFSTALDLLGQLSLEIGPEAFGSWFVREGRAGAELMVTRELTSLEVSAVDGVKCRRVA